MSSKIVYPSFKDAQQLFSQYSTIESIYLLKYHLKRIVDESFLSTVQNDDIHHIYNEIILKNYPNEICVKSSFIKQKLIKGKTHVSLLEFPIGSSRVDLCKINGESIAYEIKTDLDNLNRLNKQIKDYYKVFEKVYIICSEQNFQNILERVPKSCGIYTYRQTRSGKYIFKVLRTAEIIKKYDSIKQLKLIRGTEFYDFFEVNKCIKTKDDIISLILNRYSPETINEIFKKILKNRFKSQWLFLKQNYNEIYEIDYQWFYKNQIPPSRVYITDKS